MVLNETCNSETYKNSFKRAKFKRRQITLSYNPKFYLTNSKLLFYQISLSLLQIFHTVLIGVTSWLACVCCFRQELRKSPIYKGKFKEKLLLGTVKLDGYLSYFASIIDPIIGKKGIIGLGGHFEDNKNKPHEISFNYKCRGINIIGFFEYMPKSNTMWYFDHYLIFKMKKEFRC